MWQKYDETRIAPSRVEEVAVEKQKAFWNWWNEKYRENGKPLPELHQRQASVALEWLTGIGRRDLDILEVGCGSGWLCEKLLQFGNIVGTDLSDEVLARVQARLPQATFISGDFLTMDFQAASSDVVVSLEVLAHVGDQRNFLERIARVLRPGGWLILATQNRFTLERWSQVPPRGKGQIRCWVNASELRALLSEHFDIRELISIVPVGDRGLPIPWASVGDRS